jgi:hypothetical protein
MTNSSALVPRGALKGIAVGLSVSDSADLSRLGLAPQHCTLAVAEIARAVLVAGGSLVYGGRLVPAGFTQVLLDEVRRFADDRDALVICLAASEHLKLSATYLRAFTQEIHRSARVVLLDEGGDEVTLSERGSLERVDAPRALSGMRRHITGAVQARVVLGGQIAGSHGAMPGVVEEAILALRASQPLYVAGGFGGAAAAVAKTLALDDFKWAPGSFPAGVETIAGPLTLLAREAGSGLADDGLDSAERGQLAVTHRPADIASLTVLGLSRTA